MARWIFSKGVVVTIVVSGILVVHPSSDATTQSGSGGGGGTVVRSLEDLVKVSTLVAEIQVEQVYPGARVPGGQRGPIYTDTILRVVNQFKGSKLSSGRFVVAQPGGSVEGESPHQRKQFLMQPGELYLVFVGPVEAVRLQALPQRPDAPRYELGRSWRIESGTVHVTETGAASWRAYDNVSIDHLGGEIRNIVDPSRQ